MEFETILGQVIAKANHYLPVKRKNGEMQLIKDDVIRTYEKNFCKQCCIYKNRQINVPFKFVAHVYCINNKYDIDNSIKTVLDCLQYCGAITDDNLLTELSVFKHISKTKPRIEFAIMPLQNSLFD